MDGVLPKLRGVDVKRLSGGATTAAAKAEASDPAGATDERQVKTYKCWLCVKRLSGGATTAAAKAEALETIETSHIRCPCRAHLRPAVLGLAPGDHDVRTAVCCTD